jgi:hypothetical protein
MRTKVHILIWIWLFAGTVTTMAIPKPHVITFGKATSAKWFVGPDGNTPLDLRVRALYVDARLKEYTTGPAHEVTDRLFVVQRAFRLNDTLPDEAAGAARWQWQRGGWLLVDRLTGRVAPIALPEFDPFYSTASWYRDYVAYCGVSESGRKMYALVAQLGRRRLILKRPMGEAGGDGGLEFECNAPGWQRSPTRVTFRPQDGPSVTFAVRDHAVEFVNDEDDEEEAASKELVQRTLRRSVSRGLDRRHLLGDRLCRNLGAGYQDD